MGSADEAKRRLLGCKQPRLIDQKLEQVLPDYESEGGLLLMEAGEEERGKDPSVVPLEAEDQQGTDYWRKQYDKQIQRTREWKAIAIRQAGEIDAFKGQINSLNTKLISMRGQRDRALKESITSLKKLQAAKATAEEDAEIVGLFRDHLSESKPGDGNEWEERARQIMWNEEDAKAEDIEE